MDIDLGNGMDGTEAASRILEDRNVPIVFLTSHSEREEILGAWFGDLLPPDQVELFRERFPLFKARGHIEKVDFQLRRSDGSFVHTLINGCIAYQEDGTFSHTVCIFQVATIG